MHVLIGIFLWNKQIKTKTKKIEKLNIKKKTKNKTIIILIIIIIMIIILFYDDYYC